MTFKYFYFINLYIYGVEYMGQISPPHMIEFIS